MTVAVTRLQINIVKAVHPIQPTSASDVPSAQFRRRRTTGKSFSQSQLADISRRASSHMQLQNITESRQATQIRIETSVLSVPDDEWEIIRSNSVARNYSDGETTLTSTFNGEEKQKLNPILEVDAGVHPGAYAL